MKVSEEDRKKQGIRLANALKECGIRQCELAKKLNCTTVYVSNLCNGKKPINEELAKKIADYLNTVHGPAVISESELKSMGIGLKDMGANEKEKKFPYYDADYFTLYSDVPNDADYLRMVYSNSRLINENMRRFFREIGLDIKIDLNSHNLYSLYRIFFDNLETDINGVNLQREAMRSFSSTDAKMTITSIKNGASISLSADEIILLFCDIQQFILHRIESEFTRHNFQSWNRIHKLAPDGNFPPNSDKNSVNTFWALLKEITETQKYEDNK
ncbi:MAG: helix-turn-helix transcriptional regulator [Lachnospiraceae bacterium]|nr:helix-turn-helix transcriptional regulator [Lachnospiraceae bacterium]